MNYSERAWIEVSLDALSYNYNKIRSIITGKYMSVIKANAYGHGAVPIANKMVQLGADWFGVASLSEAIELRQAGISLPILILGYTCPTNTHILIDKKITQTVFSEEYGRALIATAEKCGSPVNIHLKLDSGMTRLGFDISDPNKLDHIYSWITKYINITGCFTHLSVADEQSLSANQYTNLQVKRFHDATQSLKSTGLKLGLLHVGNSAFAVSNTEPVFDMVRIGIIQYGLLPSPGFAFCKDLRQVMTFCARVAMVKDIPPHTSVGYGRRFVSDKPMRIATITAGYADGYQRSLSLKSHVIIHNQPAPIVSTVCMDQFMVDVTHIHNVQMGDIAILSSSNPSDKCTLTDLAVQANTISYELACAITTRVCKIYR